MQENYGLNLPAKFKEAMGYAAKGVSDRTHKELKPAEVYDVFVSTFLKNRGVFDIPECHFRQNKEGITATVTVQETGKAPAEAVADGNGRLDAVTNALKKYFNTEFTLTTYEQHAVSEKSDSAALSFVGLEQGGKFYWGAGMDDDIIQSSIRALVSALNNFLA